MNHVFANNPPATDSFGTRLRERVWDIRDWVDFRPSVHWWPFAAAPVVVGTALLIFPTLVVGLALMASALLTLALGLLFCTFAAILVVIRAGMDVVEAQERKHRGRSHFPRFTS